MNGSATISACGCYRYELIRDGLSSGDDWCAFIMLNPSTADANQDDPTIRRCIGFARGWGFRGVRIYNLFALRSTDPKAILSHRDPVGPDNGAAIVNGVASCKRIVCAWGAFGGERVRREARKVCQLLEDCNMSCLGFTADGSPRHPLYVRADAGLWTYPKRPTLPPVDG